MSIPDWWEALLLALAAWRVFHLLGHDDLLDRPRRYVTRLGSKWEKDGDVIPADYRMGLAQFLECPYCLGFYVSLGVYLLWIWFPTETLFFSMPFALNAGVIAVHKAIGDS